MNPPIAKKVPRVTELHGETLQDDYFWLRGKENPEVHAYLQAENAYTDEVMKPTAALQETLYQEFLARIQQTDVSVPYREGGWLYYSRTEEGKQYPTHCRKCGSLEAPEDAILDLNALAVGEQFMALGARQVSDDGNLLAYTTDVTGFREYTLHVKDLHTGELFPERIPHVEAVAWAADGRTLFYVTEDDAKRPYRLWRHALGADPASAVLLYEEKDERFSLDVSRSRSRAFVFFASDSLTASEVRFLPADEPAGEFRLIQPREVEHEYHVDHRGDHFYIRTNDRGRNFRVVTAPVAAPGKENWAEVVPHRDTTMVTGIALFAGQMVLTEREDALQHVRVVDLATGEQHRVAFPEPVYAVRLDENREFETRTLRYRYESLTTPPSVYDYHVERRDAVLLKREEVLGGYDPDAYQAERIHATAPDGTRVPISLVYRKGARREGGSPLLLYGYGSYGFSTSPSFSRSRPSLLDRGVIYAIAHIRGGGEMGKPWHDQGRMLNKRNTFTDFVAAAEHLVHEGYTTPERLAVQGGSAGGLLMGAVTNLRPHLFRAVIADVPFVDVINTMLDTSIPLTVGEFEEWGNPAKPEEYAYIRGYSPYENVEAKDYPAMLVKTSLNDSQVMYWEPAKYVARLRVTKTDRNTLVLKTNMAGGHGGSSGRYDHLREVAFNYAFLLKELGVV